MCIFLATAYVHKRVSKKRVLIVDCLFAVLVKLDFEDKSLMRICLIKMYVFYFTKDRLWNVYILLFQSK